MPPQLNPAAPLPSARPARNRRAPTRADGTRVGEDDASVTAVPVPPAVPRGRRTKYGYISVFWVITDQYLAEHRSLQVGRPLASSSISILPTLKMKLSLNLNNNLSPSLKFQLNKLTL